MKRSARFCSPPLCLFVFLAIGTVPDPAVPNGIPLVVAFLNSVLHCVDSVASDSNGGVRATLSAQKPGVKP
jgi:hypothetical protein